MSNLVTSLDPPVAPEALRRAEQALREYPGCFWTRRPGLALETADDVRLVIRRLRQDGWTDAWRAASNIEKCL